MSKSAAEPLHPHWGKTFFVACLVVALAQFCADSWMRLSRCERDTALALGNFAPAEDARSPSGLTGGEHVRLLTDNASDGYNWIMQTEQMLARGEWRVRRFDGDNAPFGREVHWAAPYHWWLVTVAWVYHVLTGMPLTLSVQASCIYASPALLLLALAGLVPLVVRAFGWLAGGVFSLMAVCAPPFFDVSAAGVPLHHGLALLCGVCTVLGVLIGWGAGEEGGGAETRRRAVRWFVLSGIAGGVGLWVSAAPQVLVLFAVGAGAVGAAVAVGRSGQTDRVQWDAGVWRTWGVAGAATSLIAYLIEYFPSHLGWRLEVNHPLFALAWWGAGEVIFVCWQVAIEAGGSRPTDEVGGRQNPAPKKWSLGRLALAVASVCVLPVVMLLTSAHTFWLADRELWTLHHKYISEFAPLWSEPPPRLCFAAGLLVIPGALILATGTWLQGRRKVEFVFILVATGVLGGVALEQERWLDLCFGGIGCLLVLLWGRRFAAARRQLVVRAMAVGFVLLTCVPGLVRTGLVWREGTAVFLNSRHEAVLRDLAYWLRFRTGGQPAVVATGPDATASLIYFGGHRGLGTLYWENKDGLKTAAAFFGAPDSAAAGRMARARGLTHVILVDWNDFIDQYTDLAREGEKDGASGADSFGGELRKVSLPPRWLRPVPYEVPGWSKLPRQSILVFEVVPEQSQLEADVRLAHFLCETGMLKTANLTPQLLQELESWPESLAAQVAEARVLSVTEPARVPEAMGRISLQLQEGRQLSVEDQIELVWLLCVAQSPDLAREQMRQCIERLTEKEARCLPPSAAYHLNTLGPLLRVKPPAADLVALTRLLLPEKVRAELPAW